MPENRWNAVPSGMAVRLWHPPRLIKHNLMGEERYPFLRGDEVRRRRSNEFVAAIGVADEHGLAELPDGARRSFCKGINQFHASKLNGTVGHLRSKGED